MKDNQKKIQTNGKNVGIKFIGILDYATIKAYY